jgi:uncharacterized protein (DUF697 family)
MKRDASGEAEPAPALSPADRAVRLARAETLVKDHMLMSLAAGLIPAPTFDLVAGIAIQLALLRRLCTLYGVNFSENLARGLILTLLGSVGAGALAMGLFISGLKVVPGLGTLLGVVSMPIALSAFTYAIGKVFIAHFELGGTLLDFDAAANRAYFREMIQRGRRVASTLAPPKASESSKP